MEHLIKLFDENKKLVKAGGVIVREYNGQKEVLLISYDKKSYSFPKGHVETDNSLEKETVRECFEETGLKTRVIKELPTLEYRNTETDDNIIIHFFHMEVIGGELKKEFEDVDLKWVPIDSAEDIFDYPNLKEYIRLIKNLLV